jgi:hypothetical protein
MQTGPNGSIEKVMLWARVGIFQKLELELELELERLRSLDSRIPDPSTSKLLGFCRTPDAQA